MISVSSLISLLGFCLADMSSCHSGVLRSPTTSVWDLMCDLSFSNVSFVSLCLEHRCSELRFSLDGFFLRQPCPSLSLWIDFSLKSILLDVRIAIPACFLGPFD